MRKCFRLCRFPYEGKSDAFSGKGAALYPGRWNEVGMPCVYGAETLSLAILELCVHFGDEAPDELIGYEIDLPPKLIESVDFSRLPADWREHADRTQSYGGTWLKSRTSVALRVPSVINPRESNFIINPAHKNFGEVRISDPFQVRIDPRLK